MKRDDAGAAKKNLLASMERAGNELIFRRDSSAEQTAAHLRCRSQAPLPHEKPVAVEDDPDEQEQKDRRKNGDDHGVGIGVMIVI